MPTTENTMVLDVTAGELIVIRDALREWRTVAPAHVAENPGRLARWLELRELYDGDRISADAKVTSLLADLIDAKQPI